MYQPLSDAQKAVVKAVLFGKQKQANVINDGVVAIVGRGIAEATSGESALADEASFVEAVSSFLQTSVDTMRPVNGTVLMLIVGEQGMLNLQADGPKTVFVESAGPDTPKYNFGIYPLGETPEAEPAPVAAVPVGDMPKFTPETQKKFEDMSYTAQRDFLIQKIVPLVPEPVKQELSSPVEQALVGAQWYFKNN